MLIVAPYFGEFGWQLMRWQGVARAMSEKHDTTLVHCVKGFEYLYEDFADEIVSHLPPAHSRKSMWHCIVNEMQYEVPGDYTLKPTKGVGLGDYPQKFFKYGKSEYKYDEILIHARSTDNSGTGYRNWSVDNWRTLVNKIDGYQVVSIGSLTESEHIPGTEDMRGAPLNELADRLAGAKLLISPSSGPAHFASLCGCRHVVWSQERIEVLGITNRQRYETEWNPFKTKCWFIPTWQPTSGAVFEEVKNALSDRDYYIQ